mmetsp:Transcript_3866/g.11846  ORF Transcript_3866/g.11846 Transcript_3866/m.11846 type:complete len:348 (+) Transcript_3866:32-1075(+)
MATLRPITGASSDAAYGSMDETEAQASSMCGEEEEEDACCAACSVPANFVAEIYARRAQLLHLYLLAVVVLVSLIALYARFYEKWSLLWSVYFASYVSLGVGYGDLRIHRSALSWLSLSLIELAAVLIAPICPHFAEHVWGRVLRPASASPVFGRKGPGTLRSKVWPEALPVDKGLSRAFHFLRKASRALRLDLIKDAKNKPVAEAYVYVASAYPDWKRAALAFMRRLAADGLPEKKALLAALKAHPDSPCLSPRFKPDQKNVMQFAAFMFDYAAEIGLDALDEALPFDQLQVLEDSRTYLQNSLNPAGKIDTLHILDLAAAPDAPGPAKKKNAASPGNPSIFVVTA